MGILAKDNKQLIYIYSQSSALGRHVLPYVECLDKRIRVINLEKESISDTIWIEIISMLNMNFEDIFSTERINGISDTSKLCAGDWLKLIDNNPSILEKPIIINGNGAKILHKRADVFEFDNPTGGNFDKSPSAIKYANHKDDTLYKNAM